MDEVDAMTHAGETVGEAMGKGLRAVRVGATKATHAGAEASSRLARLAEHQLAEAALGGVAAQEQQTKRRGGKRVSAKRARKAMRRKRRDLAKTAQRLGETLAEQIEPRRRRRWPLLLALLIAGAAAASVILARRPEEVSLTAGEDEEMTNKDAEQAQRETLADQR
jgi:hypothetical protein